MQILEEDSKKKEITLIVDDLNDLWTLYNVIAQGDHVESLTQRRVVMKEGSSGERKLMNLKIEVEDVAFHEFTNRLRVKGRILEGPSDFVSYGSYHTFNVEPKNTITISKDKWLKQDLKRIKESSKFSSNFIMLFIAIESGLATISFITNYSHKIITTIRRNIPGKRYEQSFRKKFLNDFFDDIKGVIYANIKSNEINLIVVCGPGSLKDQFIKYLEEKADDDMIKNIRSIHASSGTESAIYEALKSEELSKIKKNMKLIEESELIERVMAQLGKDADLIVIGFEEVGQAAERGAISDLLVADELIRGSSPKKKLLIENIIKNVEYAQGNVQILNSQQPAGERLVDLGSLIGILRYKF